MGQTAPFWRFSVASYPDLEVKMPSKSTLSTAKTTSGDSEESSQVRNDNSYHSYNSCSMYLSFLQHCNNTVSIYFDLVYCVV